MTEVIRSVAIFALIGCVALWVWWIIGVTIAMMLNTDEWIGVALVPVFVVICAIVGMGLLWVVV